MKFFGVVLFLWNLGFIIKFSTIFAGKSILNLEKISEIDAISAYIFATSDFFSLVIPIFGVVETKFVKIFSFKHLERSQST